MKKAIGIGLMIAMVMALAGCNLFGGSVNVTITYTGTEDDGALEDLYLAIAQGAFANWPSNDDIIEQTAIEPSSEAQTHTFEVPANDNYVALIYSDENGNEEFDTDEGIRMTSTIPFVEEDTEEDLEYQY